MTIIINIFSLSASYQSEILILTPLGSQASDLPISSDLAGLHGFIIEIKVVLRLYSCTSDLNPETNIALFDHFNMLYYVSLVG